MVDERVPEQVNGILSMRGVPFTSQPDGSGFTVGYGSAAVTIAFFELLGRPVVTLRASVVQDLDLSGERELQALRLINQSNLELPLTSLALAVEDRTVFARYDMWGDQLQGDELIGALATVATAADDLDDRLIDALGSGRTTAQVWEEASQQAGGEGGPVSV